ncbi:MAG: HlyD family secretion protein [Desulfobacteraceae bacterium]|nr:HlyD family secretion protein [Desulfobacteraceae bacterium]
MEMETQTRTDSTARRQRDRNNDGRRWLVRGLIASCLLAAGLAFAPKIFYLLAHESTDDAYFRGTIVPVSAEVAGKVVKVYVRDNQLVLAGAPLLEIDQKDYRLALDLKQEAWAVARAEKGKMAAAVVEAQKSLAEARAGLADAEAQEKFAAREKERYSGLVKSGAVARRAFEQVKTAWQTAQAKRQAAASMVARAGASIETLRAGLVAQASKIKEAGEAIKVAELALARTTVKAPFAGRITQKNVDPGKYIQAGQPLLALVDQQDIWLAANFKETQIGRIKAGQPVDISIDAYPGLTLRGHVDSVQSGTGAVFSLLPPENATGNFVKVVQRLPVKIVIDSPPDPAHPLWPGLSAVPSVRVDAGRSG